MTLIIPDIHADLKRLELALSHAGDGPIAFLGDFIDQGPWSKSEPADRAVLTRVRELMDAGRAVAVMGNHELNAILYHRFDSQGRPLRKHSDKNAAQHKSFLDEFGVASPEALAWTQWFMDTLPLWHEGEGFRLVHAYWSDEDIALIKARSPDGKLKVEDLPEVAAESTPFGQAVKRITSGPEVTLPDGYFMTDAKGVQRREMRLRWWGDAKTWKEAALSVPDLSGLPDADLPPELIAANDFGAAPPTFIGHYKMAGNPKIDNADVLCLDYPYAPCAYAFKGEAEIARANLVDAARPPHPAPKEYVTRIVFEVPPSQSQRVIDVMGLLPDASLSTEARRTFVWETTGARYRGDDETIVYRLAQELGDDVSFRIDWSSSRY